MDQDAPVVSSAPSSAYYSDLSVTAIPTDRAYEVVGLTVMSTPLPHWEIDGQTHTNGRRPPRLAAINESSSVPSDYV